MAKPVKNIHWIKWHTKETIYGSYMTEPVASLGFLVKMCCLSAETRYPGYIQSEYKRGIPYHTLAPLLNVPLELFTELMGMNKKAGRLVEDGNGVIEIMNWEKFQSIEKWDGNPATIPSSLEEKGLGHLPDNDELDKQEAELLGEEGEGTKAMNALASEYGGEFDIALEIAQKKGKVTVQYLRGILQKRKEKRDKVPPARNPRALPTEYTKPEDL